MNVDAVRTGLREATAALEAAQNAAAPEGPDLDPTTVAETVTGIATDTGRLLDTLTDLLGSVAWSTTDPRAAPLDVLVREISSAANVAHAHNPR